MKKLLFLCLIICELSNGADLCSQIELNNLRQEDPKLIKLIKEKMMLEPRPSVKGKLVLNVTYSHEISDAYMRAQYGQPFAIQDLFYGNINCNQHNSYEISIITMK